MGMGTFVIWSETLCIWCIGGHLYLGIYGLDLNPAPYVL